MSRARMSKCELERLRRQVAAGKVRLVPASRLSAPKASTLTAYRLGTLKRLAYRHTDGKRYGHTFKTPVHLAVSSCGRFLVIGPTNVKPYIAP